MFQRTSTPRPHGGERQPEGGGRLAAPVMDRDALLSYEENSRNVEGKGIFAIRLLVIEASDNVSVARIRLELDPLP